MKGAVVIPREEAVPLAIGHGPAAGDGRCKGIPTPDSKCATGRAATCIHDCGMHFPLPGSQLVPSPKAQIIPDRKLLSGHPQVLGAARVRENCFFMVELIFHRFSLHLAHRLAGVNRRIEQN